MKIAPILHALDAVQPIQPSFRVRLVHTGQHWDKKMSQDFFDQLDIRAPDVNLAAGGGSQAEQTAAVMVGFERDLLEHPADLVVVVGDVNSTMACTITARKCGVEVAHVEAGIRSGDWSMPEEINRVVIDSIANHFFTTSAQASQHLLLAGIPSASIYFVGNTMIDTLIRQMPRCMPPSLWKEAALIAGGYLVMTLHRPSNVDDPQRLEQVLRIIDDRLQGLPVVFPVHPRTRKNLDQFGIMTNHILLAEPMNYLEFNWLLRHAKGVVTDSGGITEETTVLGVPCITLRDSTERPETCTIGTNELIGADPKRLEEALERLLAGQWKKGGIPLLWDGQAAERIVSVFEQIGRARGWL